MERHRRPTFNGRHRLLVAAILLTFIASACSGATDNADGDTTATSETVASGDTSTVTPVPTTAAIADEAANDEDAEAEADEAAAKAEDAEAEADEAAANDEDAAADEAAANDAGHEDANDDEAGEAAGVDSATDDGSATPATSAPTGDSSTTPVPVANGNYLGSYTLVDETYGTQVEVTVADGTRTIASNALPNHDIGSFPNPDNPNEMTAQDRSWTLTTEPVMTGRATPVRETGVALNGVKFEPGTGESVTCASGETYRIEGQQDEFSVGLDFNLAHVQPTGEYHYHGVSPLLVGAFATDADLVLVGFAGDGHLMYYSKSTAYSTSYALSTTQRTGTDCAYRGRAAAIDGSTPDGVYVSDWVYTAGSGDLDECNGITIDGQYAYLVTEAYPYVPRCLMGEVAGGAGGGRSGTAGTPGQDAGAPGQRGADQTGQGAGAPGQGGALPDFTDMAAALGVPVAELEAALGGRPPDLDAAAATLGMAADELYAVLDEFGVAPPTR